MDFLDENEDNPLFYKNLEMRAKVEAINTATRKALPSMEDMEDEHETCLTRDQIIAKYLKSNKNAKIICDCPVETGENKSQDMEKHGIEAEGEKAEKDKPSEDELARDFSDENKENRELQSYSVGRAEVDCPHTSRKISNLVGEGDCIAAQGDGCQYGPSKDELLMTKLIKCVSVDCGEYMNPVTGETIFLEEGDTKIKPHNTHLRIPTRNLKKNSLKPNNFIGQNKNPSMYIDIRPKTKNLLFQTKGERSFAGAEDKTDNCKIIVNEDAIKTSSKTDNLKTLDCLKLNLPTCPNFFDNETSLAQHMLSIFDTDDKNSLFLQANDLVHGVVEVSPSGVPRACVVDNVAEESSSCCVEYLACENLSTDLTNTVFKIQSCDKESLDEYSDPKGQDSTLASCSAEINDTVDSVWDWVTAIPRAYYAEDDYLADCVTGMSVCLENALDCRLLKETFKLTMPTSFNSKRNNQRERKGSGEMEEDSEKNPILGVASSCNDTDVNRNNQKMWSSNNAQVEDTIFETTEILETLAM